MTGMVGVSWLRDSRLILGTVGGAGLGAGEWSCGASSACCSQATRGPCCHGARLHAWLKWGRSRQRTGHRRGQGAASDTTRVGRSQKHHAGLGAHRTRACLPDWPLKCWDRGGRNHAGAPPDPCKRTSGPLWAHRNGRTERRLNGRTKRRLNGRIGRRWNGRTRNDRTGTSGAGGLRGSKRVEPDGLRVGGGCHAGGSRGKTLRWGGCRGRSRFGAGEAESTRVEPCRSPICPAGTGRATGELGWPSRDSTPGPGGSRAEMPGHGLLLPCGADVRGEPRMWPDVLRTCLRMGARAYRGRASRHSGLKV